MAGKAGKPSLQLSAGTEGLEGHRLQWRVLPLPGPATKWLPLACLGRLLMQRAEGMGQGRGESSCWAAVLRHVAGGWAQGLCRLGSTRRYSATSCLWPRCPRLPKAPAFSSSLRPRWAVVPVHPLGNDESENISDSGSPSRMCSAWVGLAQGEGGHHSLPWAPFLRTRANTSFMTYSLCRN